MRYNLAFFLSYYYIFTNWVIRAVFCPLDLQAIINSPQFLDLANSWSSFLLASICFCIFSWVVAEQTSVLKPPQVVLKKLQQRQNLNLNYLYCHCNFLGSTKFPLHLLGCRHCQWPCCKLAWDQV